NNRRAGRRSRNLAGGRQPEEGSQRETQNHETNLLRRLEQTETRYPERKAPVACNGMIFRSFRRPIGRLCYFQVSKPALTTNQDIYILPLLSDRPRSRAWQLPVLPAQD